MSRLLALVLALLAGALVACADSDSRQRAKDLLAEQGGAHGGHGRTGPTTMPALPSDPMTVEELGAALGCTPKPDVRAADYRQARCATEQGDLLLLDFATAGGQRVWLDQALDYGNTYLVGDRWVLGAPDPGDLPPLREKFGGAIESGA